MWPIYVLIFWATCFTAASPLESIYRHPKWVPNNGNSRHIPNRYIVELDDEYSGSISQFLDGDEWNVNHQYNASSIFRGFSLHLKQQDSTGKQVHAAYAGAAVSKLQRMMDQPAVKHVFPVVEIPRPVVFDNSVTRAAQAEVDISPDVIGKLPFTHALTQVDRVHRELGLTGRDLLIGIVDTGVDYMHPALGGGFGPGFKIEVGADLVGNDFNFLDPSSAQPRDSPLDDCNAMSGGHGTHVAGIIGAEDEKYGLTGVAPKAKLGMWRIFGCDGSTTNDLVIKALTMAFEAGSDVINLSLGSPNCWPEDPASVVANRIAAQNVSVVVAAGNEGENGAYMISTPATGSQVISVASIDNEYSLERTLTTDTGLQFPYDLSSTTEVFPNGTLVPFSNGPLEGDACEGSVPENNIKGAIALVKRGACQFDVKAHVAAEHGAIAVLVYDNSGQDPFEPSTQTAPIPLAAISYVAGQQLAQFKDGVHVNFNLQLSPTKISTGGQVSPFSSVGPTYENGLKPDVAAIGGYVFSTLPLYRGGYGTLSGTSMASPYIAGVCALYMEAHRSQRDALYIMEQFQNYAKIAETAQAEVYDNTIKQGAGLIQAYDAITSQIHISPASLSFNDTANRASQSVTITNYGDHQISFSVHNLPGIGVEPFNTSAPGQQLAAPVLYSNVTASLHFDTDHRNRVQLRPGESYRIDISVSDIDVPETEGSFFPMFSGHVQFQIDHIAERRKSNLHVPYVGVVGDVRTLRIFDDEYPQLGDSMGVQQNDTQYVIDRSSDQRSSVMIFTRLLLGTAHMRGLVVDDNQQKVVGTAFAIDYVQRNTMQPEVYKNGDLWNGTMVPLGLPQDSTNLVPVPDGTYRLRLEALRLLADPNDTENWESKDTPPIIVTGG